MTVMNRMLAFYVASVHNDRQCVGIAPGMIFEEEVDGGMNEERQGKHNGHVVR